MRKIYLLLFTLFCLSGIKSFSQTYFTESFEGAWYLNGNPNTPAVAAGPNAPSGWTQTRPVNNVAPSTGCSTTSGKYDWSQQTLTGTTWASSGSFPTGCTPYASTAPSTAVDGTKILWFYDGYTASGNTRLIYTPAIDLSTSTAPVISFSYSYAGSAASTLMGSLDGGTTWNTLSTIATTASNTWALRTVTIPAAYKIATAKFGFQVASTYGSYDLFIDNVIVKEPIIPAAPITFSTTVGSTSITINWKDNSTNEIGFRLYRSTDNVTFTQVGSDVASATVATTGTTYSQTATGLTANTLYYFRVSSFVDAESPYLTGSATTSALFTSITSGNWSNGATWNQSGATPTSINDVVIAAGHTVTLDGTNAANTLTINSTGSLVASSNSLTIAGTSTTGITNSGTLTVSGGTVTIGAAGGSNRRLSSSGTLTVSSGTLNINGNLVVTGSFTQSGGNINVDGNAAGVAANSVASGTSLVSLTGSASTISLTGGNFTIVDPHVSTDYSLYGSVSTATNSGTGHTFIFGDGTSTDAGGTNGFYTYLFPGSSYFILGNLVANGGSGTNRFVSTLSSTGILGNLTVNAGSEYRLSSTTYVAGNVTVNGTLTASSTLNLASFANGTAAASTNAQTISGSGIFRNATTSPTANFTSLTINNSSAAGVTFANANTLNSASYGGTVSSTLTFTNGVVNIGSNTFILGISATTVGTLTYTAGGFASGATFSRWYTTTGSGTTIAASTVPTVGAGTYPFVTGNPVAGLNANHFHRATAALTTAGTLDVKFTSGVLTSALSPAVTENALTFDQQTNSNWVVTTSNGYASSAAHSFAIQGQGSYTATTTNARLLIGGSLVGTHQAGTNLPLVERTSVPAANIAGIYTIGTIAAESPTYSAQTGAWENPSTWVGGVVPTCASIVIIQNSHNVTVSATTTGAISSMTINGGGTLTISGGSLTVGCTLNNSSLTANGNLTVSGGTLNINGNLIVASTSIFTQSGGNINVDGNAAGVTANSVATGTYLVRLTGGPTSILLTGGNLTIVDPHAGSSTSDYALYANMSAATNCGTGHTFTFGDGVSTDAGGHTNGFYTYLFAGSSYLVLGNVVVNGGVGTNRFVATTSTVGILGNLTINAGGEYRVASTNYVAGNITVNTGGILTTTSTLGFASFANGTAAASTNAQTISGAGTFRNAATTPTANFTNVNINNGSTSGVTFANANTLNSAGYGGTVSGTLTFTNGLVNIGSNTFILGVSGTTVGTLSYTAGGFVSGSTFSRWFGTTGTGTTIAANTLPTPGAGTYPFVTGNPTTSMNANHFHRATTALTTAGTLSVTFNGAAGVSTLSPAVTESTLTFDQQTNSNWVVATANGYTATANHSFAIQGQGAYVATSTNARLLIGGALVGTHQAGTNQPSVERTAVPAASIAGTYTIGLIASEAPILTAQSGAWENTSTWVGGVVPSANAAVFIQNAHTVTINAVAANSGSVNVNTGGALTVSGSTLTASGALTNSGTLIVSGGSITSATSLTNNANSTVTVSSGALNIGTTFANSGSFTASGGTTNVTGASTSGITNTATTGTFTISGGSVNVGITDNTFCNRTFTNSGTLTVSLGTLNVYGNLNIANGSTFNQSGGVISVDGNAAGIAANSVASGTNIVGFGTSGSGATLNLTGGSLIIVDPHTVTTAAGGTSNGHSLIYWGDGYRSSTGHTIQFGNGISTDAGGNTSGYQYDTWPGTGYFIAGNLTVDAPTGTNRRIVPVYSVGVEGNLTINNGEFAASATTHKIGGNITVNSLGILTNTTIINLAKWGSDLTSSGSDAVATNTQTISGTGVFRNLATSPTANFTSFTVNNSNATGVTLNIPLTISSTLTLTAGTINTTAANLLTLGVLATPSAGTLTYTAGQIAGPFKRVITAATGTYALPVGTTTVYRPASINFTTAPTAAGTLTAEFKTTAPGANGLPLTDGAVTIDAVATTGYWSIVAGDGLTGGTYTAAITGTGFPGITTPAELRVIKRATSAAAWAVEGTHVAGSGVTASRSGLTSFSEFAIASAKTSNTLPVSILNFKGDRAGSNNVLSWTTASETNNAGFELQRSVDGVNFSQLAFVNSKSINGNSSIVTNYELTDTKAPIAGSYYRLKQIDKDGKSTLSQIVFIKGIKASKLELVSIYPNPVVNLLNVSMVSPKADNIILIVSDIAGKIVVKQTASVSNGDNNIQVNVSNLAKGTYTIKAICADGCETAISKFVKQ